MKIPKDLYKEWYRYNYTSYNTYTLYTIFRGFGATTKHRSTKSLVICCGSSHFAAFQIYLALNWGNKSVWHHTEFNDIGDHGEPVADASLEAAGSPKKATRQWGWWIMRTYQESPWLLLTLNSIAIISQELIRCVKSRIWKKIHIV